MHHATLCVVRVGGARVYILSGKFVVLSFIGHCWRSVVQVCRNAIRILVCLQGAWEVRSSIIRSRRH